MFAVKRTMFFAQGRWWPIGQNHIDIFVRFAIVIKNKNVYLYKLYKDWRIDRIAKKYRYFFMESDRLFCLYTQPYPGGNLPCCHFRFGPNQGFGCGYHPVFANPPHWHQRQEWFTHLDGTSAAVSNGILHCEGRPMILICDA